MGDEGGTRRVRLLHRLPCPCCQALVALGACTNGHEEPPYGGAKGATYPQPMEDMGRAGDGAAT